jgi:putative addiction module component (TIGR02574 family)
MSNLLAELSKQAKMLSLEERAQLAEELLGSLHEDAPGDVESAWDAEILRRLQEVENGTAILVPAEDVFAEARRHFR